MAAIATQMRHFGLINALAQEKIDTEDGGSTEYKALVCVFLNGGNDSNNMIMPNYDEGYTQYSAARQSQGLAIPRANLLPVTPPNMGGQVYGLHPNLTELHNSGIRTNSPSSAMSELAPAADASAVSIRCAATAAAFFAFRSGRAI